MSKPSLVILAAGMGSRYGGLKQIDGVGPSEEGIIEYSIYDAIQAGFGKVVFIIRKDIEAPFREKFDGKFGDQIEIAYAFQEMDSYIPDGIDPTEREKPWGTAHAMLVAKEVVNEPFAVINADDYYGRQAFHTIVDFLTNEASPELHCMVGYILHRTLSDHGTVNRGVTEADADLNLVTVKERLKIMRGEDGVVTYLGDDEQRYPVADDSIVSMNFWGFHPSIFERTLTMFHEHANANIGKPRAEFLIPTVVDEMIADQSARCKVLQSADRWYGV
ncbi:MAG: sugar phosphate nucleotidyltransferase, partial [Bacteroidota bacterium]